MKNLLTYLLAILVFVACSESGPENGGSGGGGQEIPKQPEITLSTTAADFSTDGGSNVITFTSSEAWTAEVINSRADDWCSIEPTSGPAGSARITITTKENDTPNDRTASIVIKAGTTSKTINVSQKQKDALTVTSSKFEVSAEGGVYKMKYVLSNPVEGGVVKFNRSQSNYYGVLKEDSWKINTETCEIEFEVNPYDATQYSHYAYLYIAYYANETSTTSIAEASVKINQLAPAN